MFIKKGKCPLLSERAFVAACCSLDPAEILVDPDVPAAGNPSVPVVVRAVVALDTDGQWCVPLPRRLDAVDVEDELVADAITAARRSSTCVCDQLDSASTASAAVPTDDQMVRSDEGGSGTCGLHGDRTCDSDCGESHCCLPLEGNVRSLSLYRTNLSIVS